MKPDFALSLSFEGIGLLVRAAGGWRVAGEVGLDAPDLKAELAKLRAVAVDRGGQGFRTKLVIPRDQIRYLTVETGHLSAADRHAEVRRALDGATPYAVDDLVYDICEDGALTHVAAVARETLDEAESFAAEHRFNPVSFVAVPGEEAFLGEPFFGATRFSRKALTSGERVEPDGIAVVTIGKLEDAPEGAAEARPEAIPEVTAGAPAQGTAPAGAADPAPAAEPDPAPAAIAGFSTRRAAGAAPSLGGAIRAAQAATTPLPAPRITITQASPAGDTAPVPEAPAAAPEARPLPGPDRGMPKAAAPAMRAARAEPAAAPAGGSPEAATDPDAPKTWAERFLARTAAKAAEAGQETVPRPRPVPPPPAPAKPDSAPGLRMPRPKLPEALAKLQRNATGPNRAGAGAAGVAPSKVALVAAARRPLPEPHRVADVNPDEDERRRMTIFGARSGDVAVGGKPRHLGLILTAALLLFLAAVAAWASIFMEDGVAGIFGKRQPDLVAVVPGPADPAPSLPAVAEDVAEDPEPAVETPSPSPDLPESRLTDTDVAVLDALRAPEPEEAPLTEETPALPDRTEAPLTPEDAQARYAVSGIWERAPEAPRAPGLVDLDSLYLTSIDPAVPAQDAVALVAPADRTTDALPGQVSLPIEPGLSVTLGPDGRIAPTPEGAVSPDGFTVFLGRPPVVPPAPPTRFEATPTETEIAPQAPALPRIRPQTRPQGLVEGNERSQFGGLTRRELADLRPRVRPLIEAPPQAAASAETASALVLSATDQAVPASLTPRQRPSGFADVVSAARSVPAPSRAEPDPEAEADGEAEPTRVAAVASAAPSIPSSASVARQATVKNAINLRRVNLIGVYGTPSNRRALVRLANGRYQKVTVGDRLDGGQVSAIGDSELRYQKGGRNLVLSIPSG